MANWLDKYEQGGMVLKKKTKDNYGKRENANEGYSTAGPGWIGEGTTNKGFDYNGAWGGTMKMGGTMPGSVGFMYARTQNPAPANGKYTKKTKASAQNGQEMKFYQEGLDFKPKTISQNGLIMDKFQPEKVRQDATRVAAPIRPLTKKEKEENAKINAETRKRTKERDEKIIAEREAKRKTKGDVNVPGSFNIAEKARLFPNSVGGLGEMFDEYVNPLYTVGGLSDALGESIAADSPGGIAATLAMTAGLGALGFDPLGSAIKAQRLSKGALNNLGYNVQTAGNPFRGKGMPVREIDDVVAPTQDYTQYIQERNARNIAFDQRMAAIRQQNNNAPVPYQFPTDEELLEMNTREANRYYRRPSQTTPPASTTPNTNDASYITQQIAETRRRLAEVDARRAGNIDPDSFDWTVPRRPANTTNIPALDPIEEYYQRNPRPVTQRIPTEEELATVRSQFPVDREVQSNLQRASDDILQRIRNRSSTSITPAPDPQPMSVSLERALRDIDNEPSISDFISEDDLVEPAPAPYMSRPSGGVEITADDFRRISNEPIEKQWSADKFRIGEGNEPGRFVTKHPEGHNIYENIEGTDSGSLYRTYEIKDANRSSNYVKINSSQNVGDPYINIDDVSFFNRDPNSSSKQMNIVFSHLPKQARIAPINTSIYSQPLLNTRVAKLSSGQPGRIQIEPMNRMSQLNKITRAEGYNPDALYDELIDQFPKLERTYKTINQYTGSELQMPFIKYKGQPITFDQLKSNDFKRLLQEEGGDFYNDVDIMVNKYKTIKNWKNGGQIVDPMGQWAHPGKTTVIPSNDITMKGVNYDVLGVSNTGDKKLMKPGKNYKFDGDYVTEYPKGGWLNKYK
jgi:hypothetical protein